MMDVVAPNGEIANRRTAPLRYADFPISYTIGVLSDRYPTASIVPTSIPEGDDTYRIYYHVPPTAERVN